MANPYHHSLSSVKKWGGNADDYIRIHDWFDASKEMMGDFRHRALRHHTQGIFELERVFGHTITLSTGRVIPVRWVGEQHVLEDMGFIPTLSDWLINIKPQPWMNKPQKLSKQLEKEAQASAAIEAGKETVTQ
jgi:hypothetical protein